MEDKSVLIVVDKDGILIHIGAPKTFKKSLLAKYAINGCSIKTISFEEWKELGATLYQPFPSPPQTIK